MGEACSEWRQSAHSSHVRSKAEGQKKYNKRKIELSYLVTTFVTPALLVMFTHTHTDGCTHCPPTLLSELGIMASVIQEPKRDPEALTVIGVLTAVRRPQPVNERKEVKQRYVLRLNIVSGLEWVMSSAKVTWTVCLCPCHRQSQVLIQSELWKRCIAPPQDENIDWKPEIIFSLNSNKML